MRASPLAVPEINSAYDANPTYDGVLINYAKNITRLEFCKLVIKLYSALGLPEVELPATSPFGDTSDVDVLRAYQLVIINGIGNNPISPTQNATREVSILMLYRTFMKMSEVKNIELYNGNYFMLQWAPYPHLYLDIASQSMDNGASVSIWEKNG